MKQFPYVFLAFLAAVIVGFFGYEMYKNHQERTAQGYRTAAYVSQGMVLTGPMKAAVDEIYMYNGELPCTAADFREIGMEPPSLKAGAIDISVEITGCGEFSVVYSEFDGTPAGQIDLRATRASAGGGRYFSWECTSPSYTDIQDVIPTCSYAPGEVAPVPEPQPVLADDAGEAVAGRTMSCGIDLVIYRSIFTDEVVDRTPQNRLAALGPSHGKINFFTEIIGGSGKTVSHRWFHNGVPISTVPFEVKGDRWRTWSSKQLANLGPGTLSVEVHHERCLVGQESIRILDTDPEVTVHRGFMSPYNAVQTVLADPENWQSGYSSIVTMTPNQELYRFDDGDTPLHRAIRTGNRPAVLALLKHAAKMHERDIGRGLQILYDYDAGGRQALDIARDAGLSESVQNIEELLARSWPEWAVTRATFTTSMQDGEPENCRDEAYEDEASLTFFAEITDMDGRRINHEWRRDGEVEQSNQFVVGSDRWTTQSTRLLSPEDIGDWQVLVTTAEGRTLHFENLRYVELNDLNRGRRESYKNMRCNMGFEALLSYTMANAPVARLEYLLEHGTVLESRMATLVHTAVEGRNISILRWLLSKGFEIDDGIGSGHTALTLAAEIGDPNMVLFLLSRGADPDKYYDSGKLGPLEYAAQRGHAAVVRVLLEHGVDPNSGGSALRRAVQSCDSESTRLLLEYGADPLVADRNNHRPVDSVQSCINREIWTAESPEVVHLRRVSGVAP